MAITFEHVDASEVPTGYTADCDYGHSLREHMQVIEGLFLDPWEAEGEQYYIEVRNGRVFVKNVLPNGLDVDYMYDRKRHLKDVGKYQR